MEEDTQILVPLTGSIYVQGNVVNKDKFLVDVGTGFFVEKDSKGAIDLFNRKVTFLNVQIEKYVKMVQEKMFLRDNIMQVMHIKQQQMMASQASNSTSS